MKLTFFKGILWLKETMKTLKCLNHFACITLQDGMGCECMFEDKTYNRAIGEGTAPQMDAI